MSHDISIHSAQTAILRELLFLPEAGFAELQRPTGLSSDHFSFHIRQLVEVGFVEKAGRRGRYRLTVKGKEYANRLDTDNNTVERQPKVAVLLVVERWVGDRREVIFQQRHKNPYYGFWGLPTGKLRWGEDILEGAARELAEETGLTSTLTINGLYKEIAISDETDEVLEDKIFFIIRGTDPDGELKASFDGGVNVWLEPEVARAKEKVYASFNTELELADQGPFRVVESHHRITRDQF